MHTVLSVNSPAALESSVKTRSISILLDRDGTLIEDRHYLSDPEGVVLLPGVAEGLFRLAETGARLFLVSNQSGVGRGYFTESDVLACQQRLDQLLAAANVRLTDAVWCPHAPEADCQCRKPGPGLWDVLRERHHLTEDRSVMVGDKEDDLLFAENAGLAVGILVLSGKGREHAQKRGLPLPETGCLRLPGPCLRLVAADFHAAAAWIVRWIEDMDRTTPLEV